MIYFSFLISILMEDNFYLFVGLVNGTQHLMRWRDESVIKPSCMRLWLPGPLWLFPLISTWNFPPTQCKNHKHNVFWCESCQLDAPCMMYSFCNVYRPWFLKPNRASNCFWKNFRFNPGFWLVFQFLTGFAVFARLLTSFGGF